MQRACAGFPKCHRVSREAGLLCFFSRFSCVLVFFLVCLCVLLLWLRASLRVWFCGQVPKDVPWYRRDTSQMVMSGFLPFSAIYIELHYIFASVWGHQIYTLFGILILAFLLLLVVCSFITVCFFFFNPRPSQLSSSVEYGA